MPQVVLPVLAFTMQLEALYLLVVNLLLVVALGCRWVRIFPSVDLSTVTRARSVKFSFRGIGTAYTNPDICQIRQALARPRRCDRDWFNGQAAAGNLPAGPPGISNLVVNTLDTVPIGALEKSHKPPRQARIVFNGQATLR